MSAMPAESETCKILKAAHAIQISSLISFLPTILNQLFTLLVNTTSEEIGMNVIRLLINIIHLLTEAADRKDLLLSYVKLPDCNKFMKYSAIFFDIIVKSMAQHLLDSGRIKMHRNERFPKEFHDKIESLFKVFVPYLIHKYKDLPEETQELNKSICHFIKRSLTLMDRGFVFKMVRFYLQYFGPGDSRVLHEFKFQFIRELCFHEHYIPLNMPFAVNPKKQKKRNTLIQHFTLSEEFCREHYLAGLLLMEVKSSLNEVSNIRRMALGVLRELIAKHDLDDRYQNKGQLSRIALLYIPWMSVVLDNIHRIPDGTEVCKVNSHDNASLIHRMSTSSSFIFPTPTNSTPNKIKNRQTLHIEHPSPLRSSMHVRDSSYFAAIAGQIGNTNGASTCSLNSFSSDMSQEHHALNGDGGDGGEQMYIWWDNCSDSEINAFMIVLEICLYHFRYVGKINLVVSESKDFSRQAKNSKASTLPARMAPPAMENGAETNGSGTLNLTSNQRENLADEAVKNNQAMYESNLATEVGMVILDVLGWFSLKFHTAYTSARCDPNDTLKLGSVYLKFLQHGQSEHLSKHVFAALRSFINNFSLGIFKGHAVLCGQIVYELLKACDSHLVAIRHEACAVLYLLMRTNFEFSKRKGLTRVHLQVIISVSQMIGNVIGLNNARFQESLSMINTYAFSDKAMKGTGEAARAQYSLANSYASTPELRHTWLLTMARNHEQNGNISEAAMCYLHIAALMAEYLKLKGTIKWGAEAFKGISPNIARDEIGLKLDSGAQDSQYTEQMLLDQLKQCAEFLDKSERFECLGELYRLIVPIYEKRRDYYSLMSSHQHLSQVYTKIIEVNRSGKRMLGRFYRVVFYGQAYFEEDHGIEYVYKEPKLTTLSEISERLFKQYKDKFGNDLVKMIMDSSPVNVNDLDPKIAYIQVTHVIPYFCKDELDNRQNEFEQNHDVDRFVFERPYFEGPSPSGKVEDQWKAKTIIRTSYSFPYVLKRIPVKESQNSVLTPIEVAIEEMQNKVTELQEVILPPADVKKLQLRLQGSIAATVHSGPFAYAKAFLDPKNKDKIIDELRLVKIEDLKQTFRDFMEVSWTALKINERLISNDQKEYHSALHENYIKLSRELGELLNESFIPT
uniref:DOCKER domain-containing protein n=1 Tax=Megaselia scalaris TaxID=36166 RepID=T1GAE7_MEGSC